MNRILAFSSSRVGQSGYLESALPLIKEFLPGSARIAFIPFASVEQDHTPYGEMVREALSGLPVTIELVTAKHAVDVLERCDAIMVGGGNTFKLLHDLYSLDLLAHIRTKIGEGTPYIGWSAGANITGRTISTTNDMPIIQPESFRSLGFFPFQINPHYLNQKPEGHNGETRDQRLSEFVRLHPAIPVVGLPEGTALRMESGVLKFEGIVPGVLFTADATGAMFRKAIAPGDDLTHLVESW